MQRLSPLWEAVDKYPQKLIGAAGTFETLQEIYGAMNSISSENVSEVMSTYDKMLECLLSIIKLND